MTIWVKAPVLDRRTGRMSSTREISAPSSDLPGPPAGSERSWLWPDLPESVEGFPSWERSRKPSAVAMPWVMTAVSRMRKCLHYKLTYPTLIVAPVRPVWSSRTKSERTVTSRSVSAAGLKNLHISWATSQPKLRKRNCKMLVKRVANIQIPAKIYLKEINYDIQQLNFYDVKKCFAKKVNNTLPAMWEQRRTF